MIVHNALLCEFSDLFRRNAVLVLAELINLSKF